MCLYLWDYTINHDENDDENEINRPRPRHEHKYSKFKKWLSMTMVICIKQHLGNIWS